MSKLKTKADYEKMTNEELVDYLDKLNKSTFNNYVCLLYTSPSPRDRQKSRMPSSA